MSSGQIIRIGHRGAKKMAAKHDHATSIRSGRRRPRASKTAAEASGGAPNITEILRQRIVAQILAPGAKLRESELANDFSVSRTRVREAFSVLEERGLIIRIPNRGAIVARLDPKQVFEMFDVREYLEGLCARAAAVKAPDGGWDDLLQRFSRPLDEVPKHDDFRDYLDALFALRNRMIQFADNSIAASMLDLIYDKAQVIARRVVILPGRVHRGLKMHHDLLLAFIERDADRAEQIKRMIITSARDDVEKFRDFIL